MPWSQLGVLRIEDPRVGGWSGLELPIPPGIKAYAISLIPDRPFQVNWARVGFVYTAIFVSNERLTGNSETLAGYSEDGFRLLHYLNYDWFDVLASRGVQPAAYSFYMQLVPYSPPATVELLGLT